MNFSELIRNRRNELGLTLEEVARVVGVSKSTILKWERGEIDNPRRDRIALLASVLQLPPVALVNEECGEPEDYPIKKAAVEQLKNRPKTQEARIVSFGMDQLPQEDRETILNMLRAMYNKRPELFKRSDDDDA